MPLISANDFESLPLEPEKRWLQIRDVVESNFAAIEDSQNGSSLLDEIEYIEILISAADELEVAKLEGPSPANLSEEFPFFRARISALATRLGIRQARMASSSTLALSEPVKARIRQEVLVLRKVVDEADFEKRKHSKLHGLLDKFEAEIARERFDYSKGLKTLALCAAGMGGTTSFLADAPEAITTITQVIGLQQEAQDEVGKAIELGSEPPLPQLPAPPPKQLPSPKGVEA